MTKRADRNRPRNSPVKRRRGDIAPRPNFGLE